MLAKTPLTIADVAKLHLKKAKNNVTKATESMTKNVMTDSELYRALMDPLVRQACYDAIRGVVRKDRGIVWEMPQPTAAQERSAIHSAAKGIMESYYRFPLPNGTYLGEATKADVGNARDFYLNQASDMDHKGKWMGYIFDSLKNPKDVVKDALSVTQLGNLKKKAEK